jgi:hypothetical protein
MRNRNHYTDERDKLIPEAIRRTEKIVGTRIGSSVPVAHGSTFLQQMDLLARETWLVSSRGLPVDSDAVRQFLKDHDILPARTGKIVINCGPNSVGAVDFITP